MVSPHFVKRVTDDHLSAGQRNLLKRLPLVEFDDDDGHDAKVASRIVLVFEDACADLFPPLRNVIKDREHWVDILRQLIARGLGVGRYTDLLPLQWILDECRLPSYEVYISMSWHIRMLGELFTKLATDHLDGNDGYGMQAGRVLLLVLYRSCVGTTNDEMAIVCNDVEVAGQIDRFNLYAQEGHVGLCTRGVGTWDLHHFPPGVKFNVDQLQVICCDNIKGKHVVPPTGFHIDFSKMCHLRLLKTTVNAVLMKGDNSFLQDYMSGNSDDDNEAYDPLWYHLARYLTVMVSIGSTWELDLFQFVTEGKWYFVPILAVKHGGGLISDTARCHLRSDEFIDRAARWYVALLEGVGGCHSYYLDKANASLSVGPPFDFEYRENGGDKVGNWKYAVHVSV